jgi:predicted transcriptional regulator
MPSFNQSLPDATYFKVMQLADELGVPRRVIIKQAIDHYLASVDALHFEESAQAHGCAICHRELPEDVPLLKWPDDSGPFCSLRCADYPEVKALLAHGDVMITVDGNKGQYEDPARTSRKHTVNCVACSTALPPDAPRVKGGTRKYYCVDCATPQDIEMLLELPLPTEDSTQILETLKGVTS